MTLIDEVALRFEEERARAQQKKIEQAQKERAKQAEAAAKAAKKANDTSILW